MFKKGQQNFLIFPQIEAVSDGWTVKAINDVPVPKIIIAGSGMSQGGRNTCTTSKGIYPTRKARFCSSVTRRPAPWEDQILTGAKTVKIFGEEIPVRCKIKSISGYSAHADQNSFWAGCLPSGWDWRKIFIVQGRKGPDGSVGPENNRRIGGLKRKYLQWEKKLCYNSYHYEIRKHTKLRKQTTFVHSYNFVLS